MSALLTACCAQGYAFVDIEMSKGQHKKGGRFTTPNQKVPMMVFDDGVHCRGGRHCHPTCSRPLLEQVFDAMMRREQGGAGMCYFQCWLVECWPEVYNGIPWALRCEGTTGASEQQSSAEWCRRVRYSAWPGVGVLAAWHHLVPSDDSPARGSARTSASPSPSAATSRRPASRTACSSGARQWSGPPSRCGSAGSSSSCSLVRSNALPLALGWTNRALNHNALTSPPGLVQARLERPGSMGRCSRSYAQRGGCRGTTPR